MKAKYKSTILILVSCIGIGSRGQINAMQLLEPAELQEIMELKAAEGCPAQLVSSTTTTGPIQTDPSTQITGDGESTTESINTSPSTVTEPEEPEPTTAGSEKLRFSLCSLLGIWLISSYIL